jgi:nitric oxide reductase NorD protein
LVADNLSPLQRLTVECLEDARVDHLLLRHLPGLRPLLLALHPRPVEGACDPTQASCLRHRLAMLSRALLDPDHGYTGCGAAGLRTKVSRACWTARIQHPAMRDLALQHAHAPATKATSKPACFLTTR